MSSRILIVDDDVATLKAFGAMLALRLPGVSVETCESAAQALERIRSVDFDAIVSDIKMPGMDGLTLMAHTQTLRPTTPTLLTTGHGDHELGVRSLEAGAYAFIQKPIDRDYFVAWLKRAIHVRQLARRVEEQNRLLDQAVQERTAELKRALERLDLAQRAGQSGTFEWDIQTNDVSWSTAQELLYGIGPGGFGGDFESWRLAVHPDDRLAAEQAVMQAVQERTDLNTEFRIIRPDGTVRWIFASAQVLYDDQDRPLRMVGVNTDITERRRIESALTEALREADRTKDEFLAMLSHDLRDPLAAIGNAVRVLDSAAKQDPGAARAHAVIERQVGHLAHLVDHLLHVGRVTVGKIALNRQPLDLADAVASVVTAWRASGRTDRHRVIVEAGSVWVEADGTRFEQVVANLLGHALKSTPAGGSVVVRVKADGNEAVLEVQDSGVGTPPDLIGRGLTFVRRLVELHGGTVEARSAGLGRGSTFTVRLPAIAPGPRASVPAPERAVREPRRVLIIEDDEDGREMLRYTLEREGHIVYEAAEGEEGIAQVLSLAPDVALIDIGLPGLDGYEVARRMRAASPRTPLTLIALTGYGLADDRRRAEQAGFDLHLVKPVDPIKLADVIAGMRRSM